MIPGGNEGIPENPGFWWKLVHLNPALWRALIVAVAAILAGLGVTFASGLQDSIFLFITALAAIVQGLWTRGAVTANQKVVSYKEDPVDDPNIITSGKAKTLDQDAAAFAASSKEGTRVLAEPVL